jgi:hypothetical protein
MEVFIGYIIGWIILWFGIYFYNIWFKSYKTKKLLLYHSFLYGFFSWVGIILFVALFIVFLIIELHKWIEEKLSK